MFGSFGSKGGPLGSGVQVVTAQAAQAISGRPVSVPMQAGQSVQATALPRSPSAAQVAAAETRRSRRAAARTARLAGLPASDPRVQAGPPPLASSASSALAPSGGLSTSAVSDGDFTFFRKSQLSPPVGFSASFNQPAVAQNGKNAFEAWNWYAARSIDGGTTWSYIDPYAQDGMADFCCDQDVVYDRGRDKMFWQRQGSDGFPCGSGCMQNRILINVTPDGGVTLPCAVDLRGSNFGLTNAYLDFPRMSLSDNYLYLTFDVFDFTSGAYVTHLLARGDIGLLSTCASFTGFSWTFAEGWNPTMVENSREVMYMGDQIVTSTGLNTTFRVYWIMDDNTTLNSVDREIAPYLFTNAGDAHCPVPGGADPCQRADQRITGAVLEHNTPIPGNTGSAGDKIDFYWNVKEGNGFALPYVESAGFFGNTIAYVQRKFIFSSTVAYAYAAAAANDREHVGLSFLQFNSVASGLNPYHMVAIDDDFNSNPPPWEMYMAYASTGAWTANDAGDYLRVRTHSPAGVAWVASGYTRNAAASAYLPHFLIFGRVRDTNGFNRFDQK